MLDLPPLMGMKICVNPEKLKNYSNRSQMSGSGRIVDLAGLSEEFFRSLKERLKKHPKDISAYTKVLFESGVKEKVYYTDMLLLDEPCTDILMFFVDDYGYVEAETKEGKRRLENLIINQGKSTRKQIYDKEWRIAHLCGCGESDEAKDYIERNM